MSNHKKTPIITVTSRICFFGYPLSQFVFFVFRSKRTRQIKTTVGAVVAFLGSLSVLVSVLVIQSQQDETRIRSSLEQSVRLSRKLQAYTSTKDGIAYAKRLGLAERGLAKIIVSPLFPEITDLMNERNKGRVVNQRGGALEQSDLDVATEIVRRKMIIGFMSDMTESFRRFEAYFGWSAVDIYRQGMLKPADECKAKYLDKEKG